MVNPRDLEDPDWRKKYRHPSPPPGRVRKYIRIIEDVEVEELWEDLNRRIPGGIVEDVPYPENDTTDDEDDVEENCPKNKPKVSNDEEISEIKKHAGCSTSDKSTEGKVENARERKSFIDNDASTGKFISEKAEKKEA